MKSHRQIFIEAITEAKEDRFAKTFVRKADMQNMWEQSDIYYIENEVAGAIITTISKREPKTANLQLLHVFNKYRKKGLGRVMCFNALKKAIDGGAKYFRVSAEPTAIEFYKKIGFTFQGLQKSKCGLSIFKINGPNFSDGVYDINDPIINKAIYKKGKGGCVTIF